MTIKLSSDEVLTPEMYMDNIVAWITQEAKRRLKQDACCSGGLRSKIHAVAMELDRRIGEEMKDA